MVYAGRKLVFVVAYHDESLARPPAECLYDVGHHDAVCVVKPVERFVENKQFGVFNEGSCKQDQALFAAGQL